MTTAFDKYLHTITMRAEQEARADGSATIEAQHLLLAIAGEQEQATHQVLDSVGLDHRAIRNALDREFERSLATVGASPAADDFPKSNNAIKHLKMGASAKLALERSFSPVVGKKDLRPAHLLLGILQAQVGTVSRALALAGVEQADLVVRTRKILPHQDK